MKVAPLKRPPNKHLIGGLTDLLKKAEAGEIHTMVLVSQNDKGELFQTICMGAGANDYSILGCIFALMVRVSASAINNSERIDEESEDDSA